MDFVILAKGACCVHAAGMQHACSVHAACVQCACSVHAACMHKPPLSEAPGVRLTPHGPQPGALGVRLTPHGSPPGVRSWPRQDLASRLTNLNRNQERRELALRLTASLRLTWGGGGVACSVHAACMQRARSVYAAQCNCHTVIVT